MSIHTKTAVIHTSLGDIRVLLFGNHAPLTVDNFIGLATGTKEWTHPVTGAQMSSPLYDGTIFHRVISGFMIQGGDPAGNGTGKPGFAIRNEIHPELSYTEPFKLAMANSGPHTNGCQFFITTAVTPHLQGSYTIFGEVADDESRTVVRAIEALPTGAQDRPLDPPVISGITVE